MSRSIDCISDNNECFFMDFHTDTNKEKSITERKKVLRSWGVEKPKVGDRYVLRIAEVKKDNLGFKMKVEKMSKNTKGWECPKCGHVWAIWVDQSL